MTNSLVDFCIYGGVLINCIHFKLSSIVKSVYPCVVSQFGKCLQSDFKQNSRDRFLISVYYKISIYVFKIKCRLNGWCLCLMQGLDTLAYILPNLWFIISKFMRLTPAYKSFKSELNKNLSSIGFI
jgi:hypothetical protein